MWFLLMEACRGDVTCRFRHRDRVSACEVLSFFGLSDRSLSNLMSAGGVWFYGGQRGVRPVVRAGEGAEECIEN